MSIDIQSIDYNNNSSPKAFEKSLCDTGFVTISNHPISHELIDKVYSEWEAFFSNDDKFKYLFDKNSQDGFFPFLTENAKDTTVKDLKEFYHIYPWGRYPKEISDATEILYKQLLELTSTLLGWIQEETPEKVKSNFSVPLDEMIIDSKTNLLRIIHYPPLDGSEEKGAIRGAPHEDINLITLLVAGTEPGLQVLDKNNNWHDVSCDPGSIAINIGDMLQELSLIHI